MQMALPIIKGLSMGMRCEAILQAQRSAEEKVPATARGTGEAISKYGYAVPIPTQHELQPVGWSATTN
eukprot:6182790-Pleurochrysis_carterae.AAC.3